MKRGVVIALYALGGLGAAMALSFATFSIAGQKLSDPANQIQPVHQGAQAAPATPHADAGKPSSTPAARHHHQTSTPSPPSSGSGGDGTGKATGSRSSQGGSGVTSPSPSPGSDDDHTGKGDGGGGDD